MTDDGRLRDIQALQYHDKPAAEAALVIFLREVFPELVPEAVELRPSAVSLNSFNGYLTLQGGRRLFFKTHVEPDSIVGEFYNSQLMAEAGYPIIRPVYASTEYGKQFLIYDLIDAPSVFDLARTLDQAFDSQIMADLQTQQTAADKYLAEIYQATLSWQTAEDAARAPVHQLLYHRLAGKRYQDFYTDQGTPILPLDKRWIINGRRYDHTLGELIGLQHLLAPGQAGASVIGHGDAHNGNVFYFAGDRLVYFDPAFAGRHHPLLDLTKPLFHNVFASWMYHPDDYATTMRNITETHDTITVEFDEVPPGKRLDLFFESKVTHTLTPTLIDLKRRGWLQENWRQYLKMALFCCPLLTMNLLDARRFPESVKWLGLTYAVIMGSESAGSDKSPLDAALDRVEAELY